MKILDRVINIIFSFIIVGISLIACLIVFGWLKVDVATNLMQNILNNATSTKIVLVCSFILIILAIKCIFFCKTDRKDEFKTGVILENEDGKLLISKDTIENLVNSVVKGFAGTIESQAKVILDQQNAITVIVTLLVRDDVIIKELSSKIQTQVKETIKRTSDLEVKQINVRIKNIEQTKKEDSIKKPEITKKTEPVKK